MWNQTVLTRQAWLNKRQAREKWFKHFLTRPDSTSVPGQKCLNHFSIACILLNKFARSNLFGSTCNLLVSCETTREVVQIVLTRHDLTSAPGQNNVEPLVSNIVV